MTLRLKTFLAALSFFSLFISMGATNLWANPYEELTPDQPLYQRVKKLEDYGLLDPQDKKVLDEGKIVTRLELAFYTEKAKARISNPELVEPTATFTPAPIPTTPPLAPAEVPTVALPTPVPMMPMVNPAVRAEIDELLKELKEEAAMLKAHLTLYDQRINEQQKELDALENTQDDVNSVWKKANKSIGIPNFNTKTRFRLENLGMSGITAVNFIREQNELDLGMWSDLGGKGSISMGIIGVYNGSNASAASAPASLSIYNPDVNLQLDGSLGHWDSHFMVEGYPGALTMGDFTRGIGPTSLRRYYNPVDIKHFSDDKDMKTWDDYITSISPVPPTQAGGAIVSSFDPVFSGLYGVGTNLPLLGSDTRMILLFGRMGTSKQPPQPDRFEEGAKISKPMGPLQLDLSTEWINDDFGINQVPQMDLKSYQATLSLDLKPFMVTVEGGFSHLLSGLYDIGSAAHPTGLPTNTALEAPAGQVQVSYYPLNFFYTAISDGFADYSSKVAMAGVNFQSYGVYPGPNFTASTFLDAYGLVGEVDDLVSDRYGWRANLGWDGRKQDWMKSWPSFLDDIIVNFDLAQKTEYRAMYSPEGYNVVEAFNMLTPFYQEDEGIWGLDLWGGYAAEPWLPARQAYDNNIQAFRNDGNTSGDDTRYQFTLSSERIPLIIPVYSSPGVIATDSAGHNMYINITDLKTYNYVTLTTKFQFNKMLGFDTPFYGSAFFTDNRVSGKAIDPTQSDISDLFDQTVYDFNLMYKLLHDINIMGEYGWENWNSAYTYPLVDYRTDVVGLGFAYDIPWGGGKLEVRYKDVNFHDVYVPANNYHTGQWISELYFLF